ncbi:Calcium-binding mitochondrial carrier Aralar1 [Paramuricea clavata]|uniref:Calcium-binding mitochondrial carrier Aralar1 n=2 Tax=Paramuricea clavata TaxID=317549 RepID=A0A7D9JBL5_PARCT|nr:Calcium-binding mitochondrial carrier Aralar1 [Paramuricea clavata]
MDIDRHWSRSILYRLLSPAYCSDGKTNRPSADYSVTKSSPETLKKIFLKYATVEEDEEMFMTPEDFIRTFLGMQKEDNYNIETLKLLSGVVDQTKDGLISFSELLAFESLLCCPDAQFRIVFQLFDLDGKGSVSFDEFSRVIMKTQQHQKFHFNFESPFITRFFGDDKLKEIPYSEFTQLLEDYQKEHIKQAFYQCKLNKGTITAKDFSTIMKTCRPHVLSPYVHEHLLTVQYFKFVAGYDINGLLTEREVRTVKYQTEVF